MFNACKKFHTKCIYFLTNSFLTSYFSSGLLLLAAVEDLTERVSYFAYSLSALSFVCAILFAIDLLFFREMKTFTNTQSQTDVESATNLLYTKKFTIPTNTESNLSNMCCGISKTSKSFKKEAFLRTDL